MGLLFWISFVDNHRVSDSDRTTLLHSVHNMLSFNNFDTSSRNRISYDFLNPNCFYFNISFGTIRVFMFLCMLLLLL